MQNFLIDYNNNPSLELLDQQWEEAARQDLHHSVMLFARMSLEKRSRSNRLTLPECTRLYEAISISGYYTNDTNDKKLASELVENLCTNKDIRPESRELARNNQLFYTKTLEQLIGPYSSKKLVYDFEYNSTNPSILYWRDELWLVQRTVNYKIDAQGRYNTGLNDPIITKNYLVRLNRNYEIIDCKAIVDPNGWPDPIWNLVQGFEDCRLFFVGDKLYCTATVRECHSQGLCQTILFDLDPDSAKLANGRILNCPAPELHQKNWMPFVGSDQIQFLYLCDPTIVLGDRGQIIKQSTPSLNLDNFRGGGQVIKFGSGYLAIIHESIVQQNNLRDYVHRFITLDKNFCINGISPRFKFCLQRIEFAAGLTIDPVSNRLLVSYGIYDRESWISELDINSVRKIINPIQVIDGPRGP